MADPLPPSATALPTGAAMSDAQRTESDAQRIERGAHTGEPAQAAQPGTGELFVAFVKVALSGFGGALPWSRRMMVEQKRWMTAEEFNEAFALCQFLPGPNAVNFSVVFGARFGGARGAVAALVGLLGPPFVIITVLAVLYAEFGELAVLGRMLTGVSAAAAGLLVAMVGKMAVPLFAKRGWAPVVALAAFAAVAILRIPLPLVFVVLTPVSVAIAWLKRGPA
jgi:chromate transporter